jgi:hypothetical protein
MNKKSSAPDFGRKQHKPRPSHSSEREMARIEKSNSRFTSLSGGGKSYLESTGHDGTRAKHPDLFNRHIGTLKKGEADTRK